MNVRFVKSAEKELTSLDNQLAKRILSKIKLLSSDPYGQNSQKLEGGKGYRIRIGEYRVVYVINKEDKMVLVIKIGHRREIYKVF